MVGCDAGTTSAACHAAGCGLAGVAAPPPSRCTALQGRHSAPCAAHVHSNTTQHCHSTVRKINCTKLYRTAELLCSPTTFGCLLCVQPLNLGWLGGGLGMTVCLPQSSRCMAVLWLLLAICAWSWQVCNARSNSRSSGTCNESAAGRQAGKWGGGGMPARACLPTWNGHLLPRGQARGHERPPGL